MRTNLSKKTADFDARIEAMASRLADLGVTIVAKDYSAECFGSWRLIAGDEKKQVDFTYEGKDSCLIFGEATTGPGGIHGLQHRQFATRNGEDPLAFVEEVLVRLFHEAADPT